MFAFVVVAATGPREVPSRATDLLRCPQPADLPFEAARHVVWHDPTHRVWFAGWEAEDRVGIGPHWTVGPDGVTAFGGAPWHDAHPWAPDRPWIEQLADLFATRPLADLAPHLDGAFTAVSLGPDGRGCVTADPLGMSVLVRAEGDGVVVASSRAALAARLVSGGAPPARDVEAAAWMIYQSTLAGGHTGFRDVRRVPEGSLLRLGPDRPLAVETWDPTPWLDPSIAGSAGLADVAAIAEPAADRIRALLRAHAEVPSWDRTFELTGGHDSRLLFALTVEQGLTGRFSYVTWGSPSLPDVQVAGLLADRFELDHLVGGDPHRRRPDRRPPPLPGPVPAPWPPTGRRGSPPRPPTYEELVRHHVWATSGARSLWDRVRPGLQSAPSMSVCGIFGELLRSVSLGARELSGPDQIRSHVRSGGLHGDPLGILRPDVREHHHRLVVDQILALLPDGTAVVDALDGHYLRTRLREWFGSGNEHENRNRLYPLCSPSVVRAAFSLEPALRAEERLAFEIVRRASDELARMPFAGEGWPEPTVQGLGGGYPATPLPAPRRPIVPVRLLRDRLRRSHALPHRGAAPATIVVDEARTREATEHLDVLRGLLDLPRSHALFDLVDRRAAHRVLATLPEQDYYGRRSVHDLVTAAIWLDHGEAPHRPETT